MSESARFESYTNEFLRAQCIMHGEVVFPGGVRVFVWSKEGVRRLVSGELPGTAWLPENDLEARTIILAKRRFLPPRPDLFLAQWNSDTCTLTVYFEGRLCRNLTCRSLAELASALVKREGINLIQSYDRYSIIRQAANTEAPMGGGER